VRAVSLGGRAAPSLVPVGSDGGMLGVFIRDRGREECFLRIAASCSLKVTSLLVFENYKLLLLRNVGFIEKE